MGRTGVIRVDRSFINYMEMRKANYQMDCKRKVPMTEFSRIYPNLNTGNRIIFTDKKKGLIHL